jgi:hypothetical protein
VFIPKAQPRSSLGRTHTNPVRIADTLPGFRPVHKSDALTSRSWITRSGTDRLTDKSALLIRPLHSTARGAHITDVSCVYLHIWIGPISAVSVTNARLFMEL